MAGQGTKKPPGTPERLIAAAEKLFAQRGVETVSMREINRAAGSRNSSALQYYFDDLGGLHDAIVARHHDDVESRRHALLDVYELLPQPEIRPLAAALVRPLAAKLSDGDAGIAYLEILAYRLTRATPIISPEALADPRDSIYRWRIQLEALLDPEVVRMHRRFVANRFATVEIARRARHRRGHDHRYFVAHLIDLVAAVLVAPLSEETRALRPEPEADRPADVGRTPGSPATP